MSLEIRPPGMVDLRAHVAEGYVPGDPHSPSPPVFVFRRDKPGQIWFVASAALTGPFHWLEVRDGDHILIPLVPYIAASADPEVVLGFGLQLGAMAVAALPDRPLALQLAFSCPAEAIHVGDGPARRPTMRFHAGIALRVR